CIKHPQSFIIKHSTINRKGCCYANLNSFGWAAVVYVHNIQMAVQNNKYDFNDQCVSSTCRSDVHEYVGAKKQAHLKSSHSGSCSVTASFFVGSFFYFCYDD